MPMENENVFKIDRNQKVELLRLVSLFRNLSDRQLQHIVEATEEVTLKVEQKLFDEGDPKDSLYVIAKGQVLVGTIEKPIGLLSEGRVIDENALLDRRPRKTSVMATKPTILLRLSRKAFDELAHAAEEMADIVTQGMVNFVRIGLSDKSPRTKSKFPASSESQSEDKPTTNKSSDAQGNPADKTKPEQANKVAVVDKTKNKK
ncbi:MAG: cyclic nucleotide-binding domain-containing protein [Pseudomonadota bacterium]